MAEYSHKRSICVFAGETIVGWDNSADSFSTAPVGDAGAFTSSFGNSVWVDSGEYGETVTFKLLQHHPNNAHFQRIFNDQRTNLNADNAGNLRYYDPINLEEINGIGGRIVNQGTFSRGNAHNTMTWTVVFPKLDKKLPVR